MQERLGGDVKKTINGTRYDTEKACLVGDYYTRRLATDDSRFWKAALYKTKRSGKYFLFGQGNAMTRFAAHAGGWGEKIIPMSTQEAHEWAKQYLDAEVVRQHFKELKP